MSPYQITLTLAIVRMVVIFYLFWGVLPRLFLKDRHLRVQRDRFVAGFVFFGAVVLIIGHALVIFKLYDTISLILCLVIMSGFFIVLKHRGDQPKLIVLIYYHFLRTLEITSRIALLKRINFKRYFPNLTPQELVWRILILSTLFAAGFLRLQPVFKVAAPFSVESYKTLEYVKGLEIRELFPDNVYIPKGMHFIIEVFARLGQIDTGLMVHIFGAMSSLVLIYVIYWAVIRLTHNKAAGLISAMIFGLFSSMLPVNMKHQVEANTIIIGAVFALPTIIFLLELLIQPRRSIIILIFLGYIATFLISVFWAGMLMLVTVPILITLISLNRKFNIISFSIWIPLGVLVLILAILIALFKLVSENILINGIITNLMYDDYFNRFLNYQTYFSKFTMLWIGLSFSILLYILSFFARRRHFSIGLNFIGLCIGILIFLWHLKELELNDLFFASQVSFVFSVIICIALGLLVNFVFMLTQRSIKNPTSPFNLGIEMAVVITAMIFLALNFKPEKIVFNSQTEPDSFVQNIYRIKSEFPAYSWTVVSHLGTKIQIQNNAYYMDYLYFFENYKPEMMYYDQQNSFASKNVFIFVEKDARQSNIATELLPKIENLMGRLNKWCLDYQEIHSNMSIYYEDDLIKIYRIDNNFFRI